MLRRLLSLGLLLTVCASTAWALVPHDHGEMGSKIKRIPSALTETVTTADDAAPSAAFDAFVAAEGGEWWGRLDARTGHAALISGSGIAIAPGRGNDLDAAVVGAASLEERVRSLVAKHGSLLAPTMGELVLSEARSRVLDDGRLAYVDFDWAIEGRKVQGARVFARIRHGNVIQLGTELLGGTAAPSAPALTANEAYERAYEHAGGRTELDVAFGEPQIFYLPVAEAGELRYRLVWEVSFRRVDEVETWVARVDAHDGSIVEFYDGNHYEGAVTGGVFPRTVVDEEIELPFQHTQVDGAGVTNSGGEFPFSGGVVSTGLDGRFFNTSCEACVDPAQAFVSTDMGLGLLRLGFGGSDEIGNGLSTRAERNSFFHLNVVRDLATKWLDIGFLDINMRTNVNIANTCNAFYNGTVNFYRSGGGCNNTGEIADVMQHEWGHGIDNNTQGGDSATGEGTADHVSMMVQRDPVIGPYFRTTGAGVRNLDRFNNDRGTLTTDNISSKCSPGGSCTGPLGYQCHCEGEIYGQSGWDLSQALVAKHGYQTGWLEHERIFFKSLPQAGTYLSGQADSIYDAYLAVDDDDGNLANGTPNGQEIFDAFDVHGIAGSNVGSSPTCARPAEPTVNASSDCAGISLSWDAVPGAVDYRVMRNVLGPERAFLPRAIVTETSFVDDEVRPGVTYHYIVEARTADGCGSTVESVVTVDGPERPLLDLFAVESSDTPTGNRSGTVDPGETVELFLSLENVTDTPAGAISGTIATSTPGVTVELGTQDFSDSFGLDVSTNPQGFQIALDETVSCGSFVELTLSLTDDSGCTTAAQPFRVKVGVDEPRQQDTFDTDLGWIFDAASSSASSGDWTRGAPDGTSYQPGADADDDGQLCWFTAPNPSGDGGDDVDDGEVVLLSPNFDLSALSAATLNYQRWFANRDLGEDPDDYFWVEASDNGGSTWTTVERLGSDDSAAAWTPMSFDLGSLISLTDQVRFRVRVSDGTLDGNLIEGGFDDFRITEPVCDDTPPCFVAPTFDGLETATPGPDCAEASLDWNAASTNCENAAISYSVYRSTDPAFVPATSNRIANGLTSTSFQDSLLAPGAEYHYVVRADDTRSGQDGNLERKSAVAPASPDTKAPLFDGVVSVTPGAGCGETIVSWAEAQETCSAPVVYRVYRSTAAGFTPSSETLVAETTDLSITDAGLMPNLDYHYVVRAADQSALEDANLVERSTTSTVLDEVLTIEDFEAGANGWARSGTNDATTGLWELGDPDQTDAQPGDCPSGTACWATGLSATSLGDNDIDGGTTTLLSERFSLLGMESPAVRYLRYYSNDTGSTPGTDTWVVEISNDDGANWSTVESTQQSDAGLVFREVEFPIEGVLAPTDQMRLRFVASDLPEGSIVEAVVDDVSTVDLTGGCDGCGAPPSVGTIFVTRDGDDVVLDWVDDPVTAGRFKVYTLEGAAFDERSLLGTTTGKTYRHANGTLYDQLTAYRVSAIDECAQEGPLK